MVTPLDRLAEVVGRMTAGPWTQCSGTDVRVFYERPNPHSHRMANASTLENAAGIAALRNLAPLLIEVVRWAGNGPCRHSSAFKIDNVTCPTCVALAALDSAITKELGG